jgi:hypothetical protein
LVVANGVGDGTQAALMFDRYDGGRYAAKRGGTMRRFGRLLFVALIFVPCPASAQGGNPLGPEFRVNTYTTSGQRQPAVASASSGNFVVVWASIQYGGCCDVFGQRYDSAGATLGPEFRVNTYTTNYQRGPAVASDSSGNFVVVWDSVDQDGSYRGVFGQRYRAIVPVELMHFEVE